MESLFIQISDDVDISILKHVHIWLVLWCRGTYNYNQYTNKYNHFVLGKIAFNLLAYIFI